MALEHVRDRMLVLTGAGADLLRCRYQERFVDAESQHYRQYIAVRQQCSDGLCYWGYLWDCLRKPWRQVTPREISESPRMKAFAVYAMWDIHSRDRIFIPNYWKFPKEAVLSAKGCDLLSAAPDLPEDVYFFDDSFTWTLILTHEHDENGLRWCLAGGDA